MFKTIIKETFVKIYQECWLCGWPTFKSFQLCDHCKCVLENKSPKRGLHTNSPFLFSYLWEWTESQDPWLKALIYQLKNKAPTEIHQWLIQHWISSLTEREKRILAGRPYVVPSPKNPKKKQDHAHSLATEIAKQFDLPMRDLLRRNSSKQKNKNRYERSQMKMEIHNSQAITKGRPILFVDDVYTTGFTVQAAWEALGKPTNFRIWTLAYRPSWN